MSFLHCPIVYPTGLRDKRKQPDPQVVSCSINCVLPTGKSGIKDDFQSILCSLSIRKCNACIVFTLHFIFSMRVACTQASMGALSEL